MVSQDEVIGGSPLIHRFVGDDTYPLCLNIGQIKVLQRTLQAGPSQVLTRLMDGSWLVDDVIETIRIGLWGGGMEDVAAKQLVTDYITSGWLLKYHLVAVATLQAALSGDPGDPLDLGEPMAPANPTTV